MLRKWNKFCISFDFEKNEAQTAFNGRVSALIKNPDANPNMKGESLSPPCTQSPSSRDL